MVNPEIHELFFQLQPRGFEARMGLNVSVKGNNKPFTMEKELFAIPLPGSIAVRSIYSNHFPSVQDRWRLE